MKAVGGRYALGSPRGRAMRIHLALKGKSLGKARPSFWVSPCIFRIEFLQLTGRGGVQEMMQIVVPLRRIADRPAFSSRARRRRLFSSFSRIR